MVGTVDSMDLKSEPKDVYLKCEPKPHPACVLKWTVALVEEGYDLETAKRLARERCLMEGKLHGLSKLKCKLAELVAKEFMRGGGLYGKQS